MKKPLIPYILCWSFALILALPSATIAQQTDPGAALYRQAATIVNDARTFNNATGTKTVQTFMIPYPTLVSRKTKVTVTVANAVVRKLTYVSYDEGHTASGVETFYFDDKGKFVCHVNKSTGVLSYDVYIDSVLVLWTKPDDAANHIMKGENALFQQAANKFVIDYYLGAAGYTNYSTFSITSHNKFLLRVLKDMPLHQSAAAASATLETLKKGTQVYFVDRSPNLDSVANVGRWVWYKVNTKKGLVGWIWGYPSGIKEVTYE